VVLAGPNGAGKTNVLDAISLLSPGRGLRGAKLAEHTRKGPAASEETLWGRWLLPCRAAAPSMKSAPAYPGVRIPSGAIERRGAQSSADLGDIVQLIWLTPAMDRLFIESAGGRRPLSGPGLGAGFRCRPCPYCHALRNSHAGARAASQIRSPRSLLAGGGWKTRWRKPVSRSPARAR
jgi:hypothetical protein